MFNNLYRVLAVLIYPLLLTLVFISVYRHKDYKEVIKKNAKHLIINTLLITILFTIFIYIFFSLEKTIYSWDYSGHWIRSINLRNIFFERPNTLFQEIYNSMNNSDYSYLPALFSLPFSIISVEYKFFCIGNFICFVIPCFVLLQIAYYKYFESHKYLPVFIFVAFYPLYYTIFEGKPCVCGLLFIIASYLLLFFQDINNIDTKDVILINLFTYISIFERRWYLYSIVVLYLSFLIKYFLSLKLIDNKVKFFFNRIFLSGIIMLILVLLFNRQFFLNALTNEYSVIYSTYNKSGKLISFINYYSIFILLISFLGFIYLYRKNKTLLIINLFSLIISTIMFWSVQSFETHHYYISMINIIIPFSIGLFFLFNKIHKYVYVVLCILIVQAALVFVDCKTIPLLTTIKRTPQQMSNIDEYKELCSYMKDLLGDDGVAYICGSSSIFNEDIIRNSQLPDLEMPAFEYAQVDLVDGFPNDIDYIRYILIPEPFQYYDKESQHVHEILASAIQNKAEFKEIYKLYDTYTLSNIKIKIYEKQGEYTKDMKNYLYDEIIKYYPDNKEIFKEILE